MDAASVQAILSSFGGYSPTLPPIINSAILELFRGASDPHRPMSGPDRQLLERNFEVSISVLHPFVLASPHDRAMAVIGRAVRGGDPFALYLRNFDLGAAEAGPRTLVESGGERGLFEQFFVVKMDDQNFQTVLQRDVEPLIPLLAIENGVFEFRTEGDLPRLRLPSQSWQEVVRKLIASAALILVYIDKETPGVSAELAMIRDAARQTHTIIIKALATAERLGDFPSIIDWDDERGPSLLAEALQQMQPFEAAAPLALLPADVPRPETPPVVSRGADALIDLAFTAAGRAIQMGGSLVEATDALVVAIAASFWNANVLARSVAYKRLAMVQHERRQVGYARANLERFLDIVEDRGRTSGEHLLPVLAGLEPLVDELRMTDGHDTAAVRYDRMRALIPAPRPG
jgi:hypothetical protein